MRARFLFRRIAAAALACVAPALNGTAQIATTEAAPDDALAPRFIANVRLRYEAADDEAFSKPADALTLRLRATVEAGLGPRTAVLVEGEGIWAIVDDFNDGRENWELDQTVILDPEGIELNRFQILSEPIDALRITVGRQNIVLDDERFVGVAGFRQNAQSFDAVRVGVRGPVSTFFDATYLRQTQRVFGNKSDFGEFEGDSYLLNVNAPTPLGRLTLFHYALDLETGPEAARDTTFSSRTTGARLVGRRHWGDLGLVWEGSYARQTDFADNPLDYAADYWLAALTAEYRRATVTVRAETLGGDDEQAFQTPLATVHRFQGDADVFMMTPQVGIRDLSAGLEWRFGDVGPLRAVTARLRGHVFDADQGGGDIGREIDAEVSARYGRTTFSAAYADFAGAGPFADVRRLFLTIAHAF